MSILRCPRCGQGELYRGLLTVVSECSACGLPLREHEQGDGPAFAGILIIGALSAIGAAILDIKAQPPLWVHAAIWIPFVLIGSILCLRYGKALLIAAQYRLKPEDFSGQGDT